MKIAAHSGGPLYRLDIRNNVAKPRLFDAVFDQLMQMIRSAESGRPLATKELLMDADENIVGKKFMNFRNAGIVFEVTSEV